MIFPKNSFTRTLFGSRLRDTSQLRWRVVGASVVGTDHQAHGRACEDWHASDRTSDNVLLLAVADGAGSSTRAAEGASCAVQAAFQATTDLLVKQGEPTDEPQWYAMLQTILQTVHVVLEAQAVEAHQPEHVPQPDLSMEAEELDTEERTRMIARWLEDFDTTLQLALLTSRWLAVTQVGDGAIVIQRSDTSLQAVTWPVHGTYYNEAKFITEPDYLQFAQYKVIPQAEVRGIALFTDGLERVSLDWSRKCPFAPFFTPIFTFASQPDSTEEELEGKLSAFLASERICAQTNDDKTLLLAVRLV